MTRDELLARLAELRQARVGQVRVPHKPLHSQQGPDEIANVPDRPGGQFGQSAALSASGSTALAGLPSSRRSYQASDCQRSSVARSLGSGGS
jgi:hypothetical protein